MIFQKHFDTHTCSKNTIDPSNPNNRSQVNSNSAPLGPNSIGFQIPSFGSSALLISLTSAGSSSRSGIGGSALLIGLWIGISKLLTTGGAGCCSWFGNWGPMNASSCGNALLLLCIFASRTLLLLLLLKASSLLLPFPFSSSRGSWTLSTTSGNGGAGRGASSFTALFSSLSSQSGPPPWSI